MKKTALTTISIIIALALAAIILLSAIPSALVGCRKNSPSDETIYLKASIQTTAGDLIYSDKLDEIVPLSPQKNYLLHISQNAIFYPNGSVGGIDLAYNNLYLEYDGNIAEITPADQQEGLVGEANYILRGLTQNIQTTIKIRLTSPQEKVVPCQITVRFE